MTPLRWQFPSIASLLRPHRDAGGESLRRMTRLRPPRALYCATRDNAASVEIAPAALRRVSQALFLCDDYDAAVQARCASAPKRGSLSIEGGPRSFCGSSVSACCRPTQLGCASCRVPRGLPRGLPLFVSTLRRHRVCPIGSDAHYDVAIVGRRTGLAPRCCWPVRAAG